ncbi:Acyl-CoA dehydrogenase/oxidase C-terminal [Syntrophomonas zehnderi OL-4]|uniref:Acyl-CoA dehydrogenase/oxidase C-terminal n=1 Tax=Syntrophomonas zehnderi OL-4 TaxID=690567 RepID=A0A0E4GAC9_9FIRM|nr:acyl-CoA dehydrogenase [Syntrophomonas zehnderi]CFX29202.1 Acyl-CoA dehydrogenase/oxidase C-terminal [Syntrophomonas zehnderi OL-4]
MSANFINSTRDHKFILKEWLNLEQVLATPRFKGGYSVDDIDFILDNALKGAREVVAPTCEEADQIGSRFENGHAFMPSACKEAYHFIQQNGFCSSNKNKNDPSAVPLSVMWSMMEYMIGANPHLGTILAGPAAAGEVLEEFGSDYLQRTYVDKMFSGEWTATMCLTEPGAGSDVGDLLTRAYPTGEPGVYNIKGTKCFISHAENGICDNTIHLVLARIEGAAPGTKGLSLFVIPQFFSDEDGHITEPNDVSVSGIEHKLGLKGNATCVLNFGEEGKCKGWLVGDPPGEDGVGAGMKQMFKVMNEERLMTGHAALSLAAVAYHNAVAYSQERIQGRPLTDPKGERVPILQHEDVRRMLLFQKSHIEVFRAMIINNFYLLDLAYNSPDKNLARYCANLAEVNIPIIKAYCSDMAIECISTAMQCYGGYGFSEEYPIAELYRDCRIYPIWEGTNYIQAMDLVGRKFTLGKGQVFADWLKEITDFVNKNEGTNGFEREFALMAEALQNYQGILATLGNYIGENKISMMPLFATRILHATGKLLGGKLILDQALLAQSKINQLGSEHFDYAFYNGKIAAARFYVRNIVPEIGTTLSIFKDGDTSALDIMEEAFLV